MIVHDASRNDAHVSVNVDDVHVNRKIFSQSEAKGDVMTSQIDCHTQATQGIWYEFRVDPWMSKWNLFARISNRILFFWASIRVNKQLDVSRSTMKCMHIKAKYTIRCASVARRIYSNSFGISCGVQNNVGAVRCQTMDLRNDLDGKICTR